MEERLEKILTTYNYKDNLPILLVGNNAPYIAKIFENMKPQHEIYTINKEKSEHLGKYHILDCQTKCMTELMYIYASGYVPEKRRNGFC